MFFMLNVCAVPFGFEDNNRPKWRHNKQMHLLQEESKQVPVPNLRESTLPDIVLSTRSQTRYRIPPETPRSLNPSSLTLNYQSRLRILKPAKSSHRERNEFQIFMNHQEFFLISSMNSCFESIIIKLLKKLRILFSFTTSEDSFKPEEEGRQTSVLLMHHDRCQIQRKHWRECGSQLRKIAEDFQISYSKKTKHRRSCFLKIGFGEAASVITSAGIFGIIFLKILKK